MTAMSPSISFQPEHSTSTTIATFERKESLFTEFGPIAFHSLSESLLSSQSFTFDGQTFNFNRITPHGIIFAQFVSTSPLSGTTDYPVAFAGFGTTMAIGGGTRLLGDRAQIDPSRGLVRTTSLGSGVRFLQ
jgi:hypothetical protein